MKKAEDVMNNFMENLRDMRQYQGIDITRPETYNYDRGVVHDAFSLEKNIVSTQSVKEIKELPIKNNECER